MLTLKEEIEQELVEWRKVIGDIESHCARYQPSKYLTLLKSRAEQNLEHLQKRLGNDSSPVEPEVSDDFGGQPLKLTGDELNTLIDLLEIFYDDHYDKLHTKLMNKKYEIVNNISQNSR